MFTKLAHNYYDECAYISYTIAMIISIMKHSSFDTDISTRGLILTEKKKTDYYNLIVYLKKKQLKKRNA